MAVERGEVPVQLTQVKELINPTQQMITGNVIIEIE